MNQLQKSKYYSSQKKTTERNSYHFISSQIVCIKVNAKAVSMFTVHSLPALWIDSVASFFMFRISQVAAVFFYTRKKEKKLDSFKTVN